VERIQENKSGKSNWWLIEMNKSIEGSIAEIQKKFNIIGRSSELRKALTSKYAGKHLLLEGEVGVGKTVLAEAIARHFDQEFFRVDGDERFNENKMVGGFDPPLVIENGYNWESFMPGPLTKAMKEGGILFLNELNRLPEGTQNVLLPAMDEERIGIPKLGVLHAEPGFYIIATQNPEEHVGVTTLGEALKDRFVWIKLNYQSEDDECRITELRSNSSDREVVRKAVKIARLTRKHPDIRRGASVRAAIDIASLMNYYDNHDEKAWIEAATSALAMKIEMEDSVERSLEAVIRDIVVQALQDFS